MKKYTDQEFLYRQTPVNYDGIAKFTSIKGNTLGWNQLVPLNAIRQSGEVVPSRGLSYTNNGNGSITFSGTASESGIASFYFIADNVLPCIQNHKYLTDANNRIFGSGTVTGSGHGFVATSNGYMRLWARITVVANTVYNLTYYPQIFDLTQMFGSSKADEIYAMEQAQSGSGVAYFRSLFPLSYYSYNQGSLLSFNGNGIKTVGFNQWDEEWEVGAYNSADGSKVSIRDQIRNKNPIRVSPSVKYFNNKGLQVYYYDANMNYLGWNMYINPSIITLPSNTYYINFNCLAGSGTTYNNDICINISDPSKNGTYEPYKESTSNFPISTYFPTGMKRAGNVYDELTENKAITRVGSRAYQSGDENNANYVTDGTTTYYPLATETETDIDTEIFYPFYGGGTEQILPVNGSTPTTAPIFADIVYYTKIDTNTPYRKFWLVNGNGDRWNLTEKEVKSFLDSPQGLGFQKSIDVTRYGERAYKNTETYNFPQVSGDVFFYDTVNATRYEKYNEFVRFLMVQPLTLYYQIPVSIYSGIADIYTLDCEVINLTKTESKTNRVLTSNIQINGLGFYQGDTVEINGTSATVTINNDGDFPVGFEIEISGDLKNPYFTLEQDGELYGEAKFNDDSSNFSSVYVNSKDGEQNVVLKQDGSILPNPLAYQDLSISNGSVYVTFVKLEKGVSTLKIGDDNDSVSGYTIRFTPMYRSI